VKQAAAAGKHVLCEKPIASTASEARLMLEACRRAGVVFMDGVMFMHNPRLLELRKEIDTPEFGGLRRVVSDFSFPGGEDFFRSNIRMRPALEPMGCLGDLGVYNLRLAIFAFGWKLPHRVSCTVHRRGPTDGQTPGVPLDCSCSLDYGGGRSAVWSNSFDAAFRQSAALVGGRRTIELDDLCLSGRAEPGGGTVEGYACGAEASSFFTVVDSSGTTENDILTLRSERRVEVYEGADRPQEVRMWETFSALCRAQCAPRTAAELMERAERRSARLEAEGAGPPTTPQERVEAARAELLREGGAEWFAQVALGTMRVLEALAESARRNGAVVELSRSEARDMGHGFLLLEVGQP
jgi:predicted dehydrogenase